MTDEVTVNADDLRAVLDDWNGGKPQRITASDEAAFEGANESAIRLRAALPTPEPSREHDDEVVEAVAVGLEGVISGLILRHERAAVVIDALADKGYEVVRSEFAERQLWREKQYDRIAELEAELDRIESDRNYWLDRAKEAVAINERLRTERDQWIDIHVDRFESGGGDDDDQELGEDSHLSSNSPTGGEGEGSGDAPLTERESLPSPPPSSDDGRMADEFAEWVESSPPPWWSEEGVDERDYLRAQLAERDERIEALEKLPTVDEVVAKFEDADGWCNFGGRFGGIELENGDAHLVLKNTLAAINELRGGGSDE